MSDTQPESKNEKARAIEKLEVEDDESRQLRMRMFWNVSFSPSRPLLDKNVYGPILDNVFAQLEKSPSTQTHHGSLNFDFGDRRTYAVDPPSERMSKQAHFHQEKT